MRVALLDLVRQHAPLREELLAATARAIDSGQFVLGEEVAALERELAAAQGRKHGVGVSSGSDALLATLMALGIGPGDEVVTTALSFFATVGAIVRIGARPVFADVGADLNLDPACAVTKVSSKTRAIVPVSLFGRRADVAAIGAGLVERVRQSRAPAPREPVRDLAIVEDGAQAIGARGLGDGARAVTLSFFPSKNLGALGDGGMVLTDDDELADRLRLLRQHGSRPKYVHASIGGNFRLDALQAAFLRVKRAHLDEWNRARAATASWYSEAFADLAYAGDLVLPSDGPGRVWHHYVLRVTDGRRDALKAHLAAEGVDSEVYYPLALHLQPCFAPLGGKVGDCPNAEAATRDALAIPLHPALTDAEKAYVVRSVRGFFARSAS